MLSLGALCAVAVVSVTLLGGSGGTFRGVRLGPLPAGVGDCVTIVEERTDCDGERAWYRVASEAPESGRCGSGRRRSENGRFCLRVLEPVEVDVDIPPLSTPER